MSFPLSSQIPTRKIIAYIASSIECRTILATKFSPISLMNDKKRFCLKVSNRNIVGG